MPLRRLLIAALPLLAVSVAASTTAFAQSKLTEALRNRDKGERLLRCQTKGDPPQIMCIEGVPSMFPPGKRPIEPQAAFATSFSLHTANNLATPKTTAKFLRGVTGSAKVARNVTPTFMKISKSLPMRYGLGVAVLSTGVIALYEMKYGPVDMSPAKPAGNNTVFVAEGLRKIGEIDPGNGAFRADVTSTKPLPAARP